MTNGVTIARVQKLLGHSSIVTTERYGHLIDDGHDGLLAPFGEAEKFWRDLLGKSNVP